MSVCPENDWESYSYQTDNGPVVVGFHTGSDKIPREQYPFCARVQIKIKKPNDYGGPEQKEAEVLWGMEDRLVEALDMAKMRCKLLGRLTHGGLRELVFQVADYAPFRPPVGRWIGRFKEYETDVSEHDGWDFFFESVWPSEGSWLLIFDRRVVDRLIESGSDPAKPHSLEFVFRGKVAGLEELYKSLAARGYGLVEASAEQSRLVMAFALPLDVGAIFRESLAHKEACGRLGLEYDGWGALVVG